MPALRGGAEADALPGVQLAEGGGAVSGKPCDPLRTPQCFGRTIGVVDRDGALLGRVHTVGQVGYFVPTGMERGERFDSWRAGLAWLVGLRRTWGQ